MPQVVVIREDGGPRRVHTHIQPSLPDALPLALALDDNLSVSLTVFMLSSVAVDLKIPEAQPPVSLAVRCDHGRHFQH